MIAVAVPMYLSVCFSRPLPDTVNRPVAASLNVTVSATPPAVNRFPDPMYLSVCFSTAVPDPVNRTVFSGGLVVVDSTSPPAVNRFPDPVNLNVNL